MQRHSNATGLSCHYISDRPAPAGPGRKAAELAEAARRGEASPARTALAHVAFDPDAALDWLERAADARDLWVTWMLIEPAFEPLHGHPRWRAVRERVFGDAVAAGAR